MEKKRSFKQLKNSFATEEEFNKFCKKLTEEYSRSEAQFARTYFTQQYNISVSCYYKILEHAIIDNLVEDVVVERMENKAAKNQSAHNESAGGSTRVKYARLKAKRYQNIAESISNEEIKDAARDFADNPDISKQDIASSYGWNKRVLDIILLKAIVDNIADDRTVDSIERRSVNNAESEKVQMTKNYFVALRKKREASKKEITL